MLQHGFERQRPTVCGDGQRKRVEPEKLHELVIEAWRRTVPKRTVARFVQGAQDGAGSTQGWCAPPPTREPWHARPARRRWHGGRRLSRAIHVWVWVLSNVR